jgi:hypothetical protein
VPAEAGINVRFWLDKGGGQHPDAARDVRKALRPGERYAGDEPSAYIVVAAGESWEAVVRRIPRREHVTIRAFDVERR